VNVIDLDEAAARPVEPPVDRLRRWRRAVIATTLLLVGALIGGSITYRQVVGRQEQLRDSTVSVLVLATRTAEGGTARRVAGLQRPASVATDVQVTMVNTGPVAINVPSLSGAQPGVTLSTTEKQRWIDPGTSVTADAVVTVECGVGYPLRDLEATLSVETVDETSRLSPVRFSAGPWNDQLDEPCRGR
jgi:archaellum component FlaF (FlaF/FlaG flagellin family)